MYYALTINTDHIITGVHESMQPIAADAFSENPDLSEDTVVVIDSPAEFQAYVDVRCYNEDGTLKSLVWCIENGFMPMPPNKEIINGELVDKEVPAEEQPQTLKQYLEEQFGAVRQEAEQKLTAMKPLMTELVKGKSADIIINAKELILPWQEGKYVIDDVRVWEGQPRRCCQAHDSTGNSEWTPAVASLWASYHGTTATTALPWVAPTGAHDIYLVNEYMIFIDNKTYKCLQNTNFSPTEYAAAWQEIV